MNIGIVGATGYTGLELCRLLLGHPHAQITRLYAQSYVGKSFSEVYPQFKGQLDIVCESFSPEDNPQVDVLFLAVPHATTHAYLDTCIAHGCRVIDLSADFRLDSKEIYQKYYDAEHQNAELMKAVPYGLPELFKEAIAKSNVVASPGCYATSVILGLHPLAKNKGINGKIIIDSKSGVTGAGRGLKLHALYPEANENISAYATGKHRHTAEMEAYLNHSVLFSPHLVPMNRGILSSMYVSLSKPMTQQELNDLYEDVYKNEPFVHTYLTDSPSTNMVRGTNNCLVTPKIIDKQTAVVFSVIDNLIKGASGQAIQAMNVMLGYDETMGLTAQSHYV